jgi:7-carboxy-7-deazaguanine synthase
MAYAVKEIFKTLQGEGARSGSAAVFCRFSGCNLWSGRERDRATAVCRFCDTDFVGTEGGKFSDAMDLAAAVEIAWGPVSEHRYVVFTGGEPLLQMDRPLVYALHLLGFEIAVETNGTLLPPHGIDWLCVSPKAGAPCVVWEGKELKVVYPQPGLDLEALCKWDFQHFFLQPMDGPDREANTQAALEYCLAHPRWRLSLQTHKLLGLR